MRLADICTRMACHSVCHPPRDCSEVTGKTQTLGLLLVLMQQVRLQDCLQYHLFIGALILVPIIYVHNSCNPQLVNCTKNVHISKSLGGCHASGLLAMPGSKAFSHELLLDSVVGHAATAVFAIRIGIQMLLLRLCSSRWSSKGHVQSEKMTASRFAFSF